MISKKDLCFIVVKVFLRKGARLLLLKDSFGDWDLPGGRMLLAEFRTPLEQIVARKMREELGIRVKYVLGKPAVFLRHERVEASPGSRVRIFAVGYEARYVRGTIALSPRHPRMKWVMLRTFNPRRYFKGGWLEGVLEYQALRS